MRTRWASKWFKSRGRLSGFLKFQTWTDLLLEKALGGSRRGEGRATQFVGT